MKKPLDLSALLFNFSLDSENHLESYDLSFPKNSKDISFEKQLDECRSLLDQLIGKSIDDLGPLLSISFKENKMNFLLVKLILELQGLQAPLNFSEFGNEELLCRCMGVKKSDVLSIIKDLDKKAMIDEREALKELAKQSPLGSACSSCLSETKNLIPSLSLQQREKFKVYQISPYDFQLEAARFIEKYNERNSLKAELKRGKGQKLFIEFPSDIQFNLVEFEKEMLEFLGKKTGLEPQLFFSFS